MLRSKYSIAVALLLCGSFFLRMYRITNPIADWHSFRQADTASVTREYVKHGVDFLHPKFHDLSNIASGEDNQGKDNVEGWRMVEFPLINGMLAFVIRSFNISNIALFSRLSSVAVSLVSLVALMALTKRLYGQKVAVLTGFFFGVLPYSVYYSRVILPEPFLVTAICLSLFLYLLFLENKKPVMLMSSALFFTIALLIKPTGVFFIPAFLGLRATRKWRLEASDLWTMMCFGLSVIPLVWWRTWIKQYPIGIPSNSWLLNGGGPGKRLSPVYNIRFRPAWFRWLFYERMGKLILGGAGVIPFIVGLLPKKSTKILKSFDPFVWLFGGGMLAYLSVFAAGNVQHDYYQTLLIPFVVIALALGTNRLYEFALQKTHREIALSVLFFCLVVPLMLSWKLVRGYYMINHPDIMIAGAAVDRLLPKDAKVIAPFNGDTAFLYQTNRTGWPIGNEIEKKIQEGAGYYVSVNYDDETNMLIKTHPVLERTDKYVIIDLTKKINSK
jgi:4-amino-4-deoxy-L-arabinose transferase-like glycosyltransferase